MSEKRATPADVADGLTVPPDAKVVKYKDPQGMSLYRRIQHVAVKEDVFAAEPNLQDIKQGGFTGDCYLLSALAAIRALPDGSRIIKSMIQDLGKTVVIRFFDDYRQPHYYEIDKSVPSNLGILSSGALWVKLIEKAYAVFKGGKYSVLDKGQSTDVITALTGASSYASFDGYCDLPVQARSPLSSFKEYVDGNGVYAFNELMRLSNHTPPNIKKRVCELVFQNDNEAMNLWKTWIKNKIPAWQSVIANTHPVCLHHLRKFLTQHSVSVEEEPVVQQVWSWVQKNKILPGAKYSSQYSYDQLELFAHIKKRLANHYPIIVSSSHEMEQLDGIVPSHSYAVVGIEDNPVTKRKYIIVQNPYGEDRPFFSKLLLKGGRASVDVKSDHDETGWEIKIETTNQSTCRMELSDFCAAFKYLDAMDCVSVEAINQRVEKCYPPALKN